MALPGLEWGAWLRPQEKEQKPPRGPKSYTRLTKAADLVFVGEERAPHKQNGFFCLNYGDLFLLLKVHDMGPKEK